MGAIETIVSSISELLESVAETQFGAVAAQVSTTAQLLAAVVVILTIINMAAQRVSMPMETSLSLIFRVVLVALFIGSWTQFAAVAYAIQDGLNGIAGALFSGTGFDGEQSIASAMDRMTSEVAAAATEAGGRLDIMAGLSNIYFLALIQVCGALAIVGLVVSTIGLTLAIALAPLAIMATLWQGTRALFQSWLSGTIFLMLFPVILAGTCGIILRLASDLILGLDENVETLGGTIPFGMFMILSIIMLLLTPFLAILLTGQAQAAGVMRAVTGVGAMSAMFGRGAQSVLGRPGGGGGGPTPVPPQLQGTQIEQSRRAQEARSAAWEREKARRRNSS